MELADIITLLDLRLWGDQTLGFPRIVAKVKDKLYMGKKRLFYGHYADLGKSSAGHNHLHVTVGACWARINLKNIHLIPKRCRPLLLAEQVVFLLNLKLPYQPP